MNNVTLRIALTLGMILAGTMLIATAGNTADTEKPNGDMAAQMMGELANRLKLTEQQKTDIRPILQAAAEQRRAAFEKAGIKRGERPGLLQLRKLKQPMQDIRQNTEKQLATVLDPSQMTEYLALRDEMQKKMREKARQRRKG